MARKSSTAAKKPGAPAEPKPLEVTHILLKCPGCGARNKLSRRGVRVPLSDATGKGKVIGFKTIDLPSDPAAYREGLPKGVKVVPEECQVCGCGIGSAWEFIGTVKG